MNRYASFCFVLALMLFSLASNGQGSDKKPVKIYSFTENEKYCVFADTAKIFVQPNFGAEVMRTLKVGDSISVYKVDDTLTMSGITAPWCEVVYKTGNAMRKGYLWGGLFSPVTLKIGDILFLLSMQCSDFDGEANAKIKAVRNDSVINVVSWQTENAGVWLNTSFFSSEVKSKKASCGFEGILCYRYSDMAQLPDIREKYIGWDGSKCIVFPALRSYKSSKTTYVKTKFNFSKVKNILKDGLDMETNSYKLTRSKPKGVLKNKETVHFSINKQGDFFVISGK